ncbi:MAG: hypothetical protein WD875_00550 [Pirellulales bacterium]
MRKWMLAALVGLFVASNTGCVLPLYSGDQSRRTEQLMYTSENLREFTGDWERFWFMDQPDHMTPDRTHGGIL